MSVPVFLRVFGVLGLMILCVNCGPSAYQGPPANRDVLKFLDINVWSGLDYTGTFWMGEYETAEIREKRYQVLLAQIKELDPDVIGVHEANPLPEYVERLGEDLGYDVFWHVGVGGVRAGPVGLPWNLREGDGILAKRDLKLESFSRLQLSGDYAGNFFSFHFDDATQILGARITNRGKPLYIFVTHWHASGLNTPYWKARAKALNRELKHRNFDFLEYEQKLNIGLRWRLEESKKTLEFIKSRAGENPFVLMGDFNATRETPEIQNLLEAGLIDTWEAANPGQEGVTWAPVSNRNIKKFYLKDESNDKPEYDLYDILYRELDAYPMRIDFIFARGGAKDQPGKVQVKSSRVVFDRLQDGLHTSDHFGIYSEISF